ncbi:hypothetical protein HWV62_36991 [Athelia sp. TMB]|nr:hypothetical protein HWV62_36991 [Athelia sp. TMB]
MHTLVIDDARNVGYQDTHPVKRIFDRFYRPMGQSRPRIFAAIALPEGRRFHFDSAMLKLESLVDCEFFGVSDSERTEILALPDRPTEMVVLYNAPVTTAGTRLYRELHQFDPKEEIFTPYFKAARYILAELGECASDMMWRNALDKIENTPIQPSGNDEGDVRNSHAGISLETAKVGLLETIRNWSFEVPNLDSDSWDFNVTPKFAKLVQVLQSCRPNENAFRGIVFGQSTMMSTYNLIESQTSDAFVRSRTQGRGSHLLFMAERGNDVHRAILSDSIQLDAGMRAWTDRLFGDMCSSVPPECLRETSNPYHSDSEDEETDEHILDPTTAGRIYLQDATTVIYRATAVFGGSTRNRTGSALFEFTESPGASGSAPTYVCTVLIPSGVPVHRVTGPPRATAAQARRAACYSACLELLDRNQLNYQLFPLPSNIAGRDYGAPPPTAETVSIKQTIEPQDMHSETKAQGSTRCHPRKKAEFWRFNTKSSGDKLVLYPIILSVSNTVDISRPHGPMLILTWQPFPTLGSFKVFFSGIPATVNITRGAPFDVTEEQLEDLRGYTVRICRSIMNKSFTCEMEKMQYFFAPVSINWKVQKSNQYKQWRSPDVYEHIPWDLVSLAARNWAVPLTLRNTRVLTKGTEDAVIQDRWVEFTRRYDVVRIRSDMTPLSKPGESDREFEYGSFLEYCKARRKGFEGLQKHDQPLLEVARVPTILNNLNPTSRPATLALKVPVKCDAFLKYVSSIYVFVTNPAQREGVLHFHRQHIISNRSLLQSAGACGLPQYIQGRPFSFKSWQPPNFELGSYYRDHSDGVVDSRESRVNETETPTSPLNIDGEAPIRAAGAKLKKKPKKKQSDDQQVQYLGDKAIADVAEAIIGAAYISGGRDLALKATKALSIPMPNVNRWSDFGRKMLAPPPKVTAKLREGSLQAVESIIGHKFSRPHLLAQALTHASITTYEQTSYERLEFIGDAILDFMVIRHIYDRDPQLSPGGLTLLKGAMVSNSALAAVCVQSGLQEHLLFDSYILASSIQTYTDELAAKQAAEYALAEKEDRQPGQYWLDLEPPKPLLIDTEQALSDVVESIIGAVYVSEDFWPVGAEAIFDNVLKPFYDGHVTLKTLSHHPTKVLFELLQAQGCVQFEIVKEREIDEDTEGRMSCCSVVVHDIVLARAYDSTSAFAARHASESALDALEGDAGFMAQTCDCRAQLTDRRRQVKKKAMKEVLSGFDEDEEADLLAVEGVLSLKDDDNVEEGRVV